MIDDGKSCYRRQLFHQAAFSHGIANRDIHSSMQNRYRRAILLVLDSLGVGELPDADKYGDQGSNTLAHIADAVGGLSVPNLERLGLGCITSVAGVAPVEKPDASFGKANEQSQGKDTTTGHWEIAGLPISEPFATFPNGFSTEFIETFVSDNDLPGVLGNMPASGTQIIEDLGEEHIQSGKPIVYTSADSVFQIAAHEEKFGLDRLYRLCESARLMCDPINVSRVIARPFLGTNAKDFKRTENRKDYSIVLPGRTVMDHLHQEKLDTISIGKVASIYNYQGFNREVRAKNNQEIMATVFSELERDFNGLLFANLVDFDMLYGTPTGPSRLRPGVTVV